ncbi:MAG: choice-of-anchor R domain-containing protein [bacterium]|nr:choice-of-anchor R domain-containing protein [bacterium]
MIRGRGQSGVVGILGVMIFSAIIVVIGSAMVTTSVLSMQQSQERLDSTQSIVNAESGVEDGLLQVKRSPGFGAGGATVETSFDDRNRTEYRVETIDTESCQDVRQIMASGYHDTLVRRIQVDDCPQPSVDADFVYALQAGAGGITMGNNADIIGSTYSNGNHTGENNASVSGDVWVAGTAAPDASPEHDPATVTDFIFGKSSSPNVIDVAQAFTADTSQSGKLVKVALKVKKFGNPANATIRIVTDNNNQPSGTQVAGGTLNASSVGSTLQFIDVSLTNPPTLTNGQKYWIVVDTSGSATNYWAWGVGDDNGYPNGTGKSSDRWRSSGTMTWSPVGKDFAFKAFMGSPPTYAQGVDIGGDVHANTLNQLTVGGDAYFQADNGSTIAGSSFPGSEDPPQRDLPITDANIIDFKTQGASGGTYTGDVTIALGTSQTMGPLKIDGNLTVENGSTLRITGTLYVTGTMLFSNNATIVLDPGYGADSGVIVGDGTVTISNNVLFTGSGTPNSFLLLGTTSTSDNAIDVSNNATNIILAAPKGTIRLHNNAGANALTANRLVLDNNAVVTYVSGLNDINFSNGPGGSFAVGGWREVVCDSASGPCEPVTQ